jgi:transcriptional regulator with XRE-family HTH domain
MTRYVIAQRAKVSESVISRFMSGQRSISLETADRIAEVLGVTLAASRKRLLDGPPNTSR